eukprot:TRINITY_DN2079_c0_g1_i14.p1 TRINITY_DN2079_c0_g1~~TRINITY_DN2079_c0_g1_i14.p1  ORF type:complete len:483 (-),score=186.08 TRINITY_DN2079_c0_g1_i14:66-1514(-)
MSTTSQDQIHTTEATSTSTNENSSTKQTDNTTTSTATNEDNLTNKGDSNTTEGINNESNSANEDNLTNKGDINTTEGINNESNSANEDNNTTLTKPESNEIIQPGGNSEDNLTKQTDNNTTATNEDSSTKQTDNTTTSTNEDSLTHKGDNNTTSTSTNEDSSTKQTDNTTTSNEDNNNTTATNEDNSTKLETNESIQPGGNSGDNLIKPGNKPICGDNKEDIVKPKETEKKIEKISKDTTYAGPNAQFYLGSIASRPDGDLIDNIHNSWASDFELLESHHGYIQWVFPTYEISAFNCSVRPLNYEEADVIRNDWGCAQRVIFSFRMMLRFYGFELINLSGEIGQHPVYYRNQIIDLANYSHNWLRINRILASLGELGFTPFKVKFLQILQKEVYETKKLRVCENSYSRFWSKCLDIESLDYIRKTRERNESDRGTSIFFEKQRLNDEEYQQFQNIFMSQVNKPYPEQEQKEKRKEKSFFSFF